ncbi:MAG TPA: hypothetical protein VJ717_04010 [Gemmatimonadaceae bacterium]|nr:hypothetical protein [Gemmatimonadaceae bacterium]
MKRFLLLGCVVGSLAVSDVASAQAGISLGAAVGSTYRDSKLQINDDRHGLLYLRLGLPLLPYGARADLLVLDEPNADYDVAAIASVVASLNAPLVQPYVLLGYGRYGLRTTDLDGVSYGAGLRIGGKRGLFIEGRRHEAIDRDLISIGLAF